MTITTMTVPITAMTDRLEENTRRAYLRALGMPVWIARDAVPSDSTPEGADVALAVGGPATDAPTPVADVLPSDAAGADRKPADSDASDIWARLAHDVKRCTQCRLHETRTQAVFGSGDQRASLMVVGEAPGAEEDRVGTPFVGRAGDMLTAMLHAIGISRDDVYIANVLKCRPPQNRDPRRDELSQCHDYLQHQLALVQPSVVMAVGRIAAQRLLDNDLPLGKMRGEEHHIGARQTPLVVTYHPAYLLRTPAQKALAWRDLKRVRALLASAA
ncbi:MAG: uracil-DNA glycosylase [Pseudomonadota bacterium]